jgi:hypothetical protein
MVEAGISPHILVYLILFAIDMAGLIPSFEQRVSEDNILCVVHDVGWVATGHDVNQIFN